jgi:DNA transformation protein
MEPSREFARRQIVSFGDLFDFEPLWFVAHDVGQGILKLSGGLLITKKRARQSIVRSEGTSRVAATEEYTHYVLELLAPVAPVKAAHFFGGIGLSHAAVQFAMIMDNSLYFVVDDTTRARYQAAGMQAFSYETKKGRVQVRRYFELPEDVLLDPDELRVWARESMRIASVSGRHDR